jgi:hypothetical protein
MTDPQPSGTYSDSSAPPALIGVSVNALICRKPVLRPAPLQLAAVPMSGHMGIGIRARHLAQGYVPLRY